MSTPDWQTNDSTEDETISQYDYVNCTDIISKKSEFNKLKVRDLSLTKPYSDISLTVANILKAKDISVDEIELENHIDTDGVIEFIKPINVANASIQEIRAYDGSFSSISVENKLVFSVIEAKTDNVITIISDASFYNNIQSNDICVNKISYRNGSIDQPIRFMSDVSINKSLYVADISVSHIETFNNSDSVVFKSDVSMEDILHASDFSAEILRVGDLSVNNISGSNNHIEFIADISNNTSIEINEVSLNTLHGHNGKITILNNLLVEENLKIGGELSLNNLYSENQYINFHDNTNSLYGIEKSDISIDIINPTEPPLRDIDQSNVLIINGDVSFNSTADLDWVNSAFNVIQRYDSINHVLRKNSDLPIGSLAEIINTDVNNQGRAFIYIKVDDDSWHKLVDSNNSPWYKGFTLSYEGIDMLLDANFNQDISHIRNGEYIEYPPSSKRDVSVGLQDYSDDTNFDGFNTIKFYVKKIKNEETKTYNLKIIVNDLELDNMTLRRRENNGGDAFKSISSVGISYEDSFNDFSYNNGAGWDVRLSSGTVDISTDFAKDIENTDLSNLDIKVPINNGFDLSFILEVRDDATDTLNPKVIYITKVNEVPDWTEFKLDASNQENYSHKGSQVIDQPRKHERKGTAGMYNDISFDVSYDKPTISNNRDVSYYNLDLSAIDPEGFDVSYYIETKTGDLNDWSWNWSADNSNRLKIKIPGARENGIDVSLVILAHDNNVPDVSNLIPHNLYRNDYIETSYNRTIITFRKQNAQPIWEYIKLGVSNDAFTEELDQSWNTTSSDSISGARDLSNQFYLYFEPNKDYIVNATSQDLSSYFLDLSASDDGEGFDISFIVIKNTDISHSHVSVGANYDSSKIQIDISSLLTTGKHGFDTSLVLISQDDWYYDVSSMVDGRVLDHSRNYNERILNFKHISSQILQDISYGYVDENNSIEKILYTNTENKYVAYYSKNNFHDMSLILHFNDDDLKVNFSDLSLTNKAFTDYDIKLITIGGDLIIDISGLTEVDNDNQGYTDISFDLLFKHVFKYKFLIENYYMSLGDGDFSDVSAQNIKVLGDISANGNLYILSDVSLNQKLYVVDDISGDSNLYVGGDVSINLKLYVVDDISGDSNLYVGGDVSLNQKLYVVDDISADSNLYVGGDVSLNQKLYVVDDISADANFYVGGDVSINGKLDFPTAKTNVGFNNTASGLKSSAVGSNNTASGSNSLAIGRNNTASGGESSFFSPSAIAVGNENTAIGTASTAVGHQNAASGTDSTAVGRANIASGTGSIVVGYYNVTRDSYSSAFGRDNIVDGSYSIAVGYLNTASGADSTAVGWTNIASGADSTAVGNENTASATNSSAVGWNNTASGSSSSAVGWRNKAPNTSSSAVGSYNTASGSNSTAVGRSNTSNKDYSSTVGTSNYTNGDYSTAVGYSNYASGSNSSAVGYSNTATGADSTAVGYDNHASGADSTAVGNENTASQQTSTAVGFRNTAGGNGSLAVGYANSASGTYSSAVGFYNDAGGDYSTAVGYSNNASGTSSSAVGTGNNASGTGSTAIGYKAQASDGRMYFGIQGCEEADKQIYFYKNSTVMSLKCPGAAYIGSGVYGNSDDRIKENEKLIVNATETLSKLTPQIYDKYRNMDLSGSFQVESGLIAQEVYYNAQELRHLVHLGKDTDASGNEYTPTPEEMDLSGVDIANDPDYGSHGWSKTENSSLNYQGLIAYLIKSNQELVERIEILKTENTEQKGQIIQLTTDISMIRNHIGI